MKIQNWHLRNIVTLTLIFLLIPLTVVNASAFIFQENWETGINTDIWKIYGSPQPFVSDGVGRGGSQAVDNNGDGGHSSGLITKASFKEDITNGVTVEWWLWGQGPIGGRYSGVFMGLNACPLDGNLESCEQFPLRVEASSEDNVVNYKTLHEVFSEPWAPLNGQWHKYSFAIHPNGLIDFYRDDQLKFSTTMPVDFSGYDNLRLDMRGRSINSDWFIDDINIAKPNQSSPVCSNASPSMETIWPPNHKFVSIDVLGVTDPEGDPIAITIDTIFQDEPVDAPGSGNTNPDGKGVGTTTAEVRAERVGAGNGRVYHIDFVADDGHGGTCTGEVLVGVPQDRKDDPVDDGALHDSTVP